MDQIRVLNADEVRSLVTIPMAIEAVEAAYLQKHEGTGSAWPLVFHDFVHGVRDMDLKSGNLDGDGIWGLKAISCYYDNPDRDLPVYHGTSLVFDYATGAPKALLNAMPITRYRTGAAGAVGAKWLARPDARVLAVCGDGGLAPYLISASLVALPQLNQVLVASPFGGATEASRLGGIRQEVSALLADTGFELRVSINTCLLEDAVRSADVVMTAAPSYEPYLRAEWVQPGTHVSCVGADKEGKQEVDIELVAQARLVVDDRRQAVSAGECEAAWAQGAIVGELDEIGAVIAGKLPGRTDANQITLFDTSGLALQDLATISRILDRAELEGTGTVVSI